jgi:hypothetical protein
MAQQQQQTQQQPSTVQAKKIHVAVEGLIYATSCTKINEEGKAVPGWNRHFLKSGDEVQPPMMAEDLADAIKRGIVETKLVEVDQ